MKKVARIICCGASGECKSSLRLHCLLSGSDLQQARAVLEAIGIGKVIEALRRIASRRLVNENGRYIGTRMTRMDDDLKLAAEALSLLERGK